MVYKSVSFSVNPEKNVKIVGCIEALNTNSCEQIKAFVSIIINEIYRDTVNEICRDTGQDEKKYLQDIIRTGGIRVTRFNNDRSKVRIQISRPGCSTRHKIFITISLGPDEPFILHLDEACRPG